MVAVFLLVVLLLYGLVPASKKNVYLNICMVVLFFSMAFRHQTCYMDTLGYVQDYNSLTNVSFDKVQEYIPKDFVFWKVAKVVNSICGANYTVWLSFLALLTVIPLRHFILKYSQNPMLSLMVYAALGFLFFSMAGLRQTLAMSATLVALVFLLEGKWAFFLLFCFIASLFHKTAVIFLPVIFLRYLPLNRYSILLYLGLAYMVPKYGEGLLTYFVELGVDERFGAYDIGESQISSTGLILQIVLFVMSVVFLYNKRNDKVYRLFFMMAFIGIVMQSMAFLIAEMFRASMYYSIVNIILFANAMESLGRKGRAIKLAMLVLLIAFCAISNNVNLYEPYYFFFQSPSLVK